jgi:ribosomal protein S18 acetylase RimI-like enzyme
MAGLQPFADEQLRDLMSWFPDEASCRMWGGPEFRYPFDEATFREDSKVGESPSWSLVDDDAAFIAFGQYYLRLGHCHLSRLAVSPGLRGQGIGSTLVLELCRRGQAALGANSCSLFVLPGNEPAQRLYSRLGFVVRPYPEPAPAFDGCIYMVATHPEPSTLRAMDGGK